MGQIFTIVGILAVLFGLSALVITIILLLVKWWKIKSSTKTMGVVVNVDISQGMQQSLGSTRNTLYKPTVRFQTADGRVVDYQSKISSSLDNYAVGQNVTVRYNPQFPYEAYIGTISHIFFPFFIFGFVGVMFTFVGALFIAMSLNLPN